MKSVTDPALKSWRTTLIGFFSMVTLIWPQIQTLFDADTATNPDWNLVAGAVGVFIALAFARDNSVTSKTAGAE